MKVRKPVSLLLVDPRLHPVLRVRVGGPKAARRPRTERATYQLTLNTLRFQLTPTTLRYEGRVS